MLDMDMYSGRMGNRMFQYAYVYSQMRKGIIPDVYVQGEEYFKEFAHEIKAMFATDQKPTDRVAIHVRRGDYVNNPFYVDLMTTDYYKKAMALFPNEKLMVFSDDIKWCEQQPIFRDCYFCEDKNVLQTFNKMASCKAVIIANSSFSWWAGYLCGGRVVAPKEWHTDGVERTKIPDSWIKI